MHICETSSAFLVCARREFAMFSLLFARGPRTRGSVKWNEMKKKSVALLSRSSRICVWGVVKKRRARAVRQSKTQSQKLRKVQNEWNWIFRFIFVVSLRFCVHFIINWQFNSNSSNSLLHTNRIRMRRDCCLRLPSDMPTKQKPQPLFSSSLLFQLQAECLHMWSELTVQKNVKTRIDKISPLFKRS